MKKVYLLLLPLLSLGSLAASAQKVQDKIDKVARDPKTAENAAKADIYVVNKRKVTDTVQQSPSAAKATTRKKKSKTCSKH